MPEQIRQGRIFGKEKGKWSYVKFKQIFKEEQSGKEEWGICAYRIPAFREWNAAEMDVQAHYVQTGRRIAGGMYRGRAD